MSTTTASRPTTLHRIRLFTSGLDAGAQQAALDSGADVLVADLEEFTLPAIRRLMASNLEFNPKMSPTVKRR
ncbi:MAG: citrate lyase beta subunit [Pseudomonadota bacterium]